MINFHDQVPEEVAFYRLFPFIDFHQLIRVIPHVCSVWRRLIIEKLQTLHLYPNVELNDQEHTTNKPLTNIHDDFNNNVQLNLLPFIRYVIKFVKANGMTIKHLFMNGQVGDVICRKQFGFLKNIQGNNDNVFIANRSQRETEEFCKRLANFDSYFPNSLSEPALRRLTLSESSLSSCFDMLNELVDSDTFKLLAEVCKDVQMVSLSNISAQRYLTDLICNAKIVVVDNSLVEYFNNSCHFHYSFFTDGFVPFGNYSSEYTDLFPVDSEIFYTSCKSIRLPDMSVRDFNSLFSKVVIDKDHESVEINIYPNDIYSTIQMSEVQEALDKLCDYIRYSPRLKRLTLGFGFITLFGRSCALDFSGLGSRIEDLYLRKIGDACSKIKLNSLIEGCENVKNLVLENVISKDALLVKNALSRLSNLTTIKISFYEHKKQYESSYFELISTLLRNKKLTKILFEFPYMDVFENESLLIAVLDDTSRKCWVSLKRLPLMSQETITKLKTIPQIDFKFKPIIENDSSLPEIDYDQDINTIIEQRKSFKLALQNSKVICPGCFKTLPRHAIPQHFKDFHTLSDIVHKKTVRTLATCPCCKTECTTQDLEEHLLNCPERNLKIKMLDIKSMNALTHVISGITYAPDHPIPIHYPEYLDHYY
ncbi:predicted protein [Naegleria gruberi]|uniref:Predicted protein n=1 Tax=Naegleria gruberi TaxID=5762 RepID=D2VKI1_NAEGR|nr:uncharacterized protein NAEGRDRAFT_69401 [Naegleria gruberi]EFC42694.1 predicted protein [Naegleria gruberi]|eukprot:XP_002675438.1 predicted protein [Naegleria gruberi strain NEG-M]